MDSLFSFEVTGSDGGLGKHVFPEVCDGKDSGRALLGSVNVSFRGFSDKMGQEEKMDRLDICAIEPGAN